MQGESIRIPPERLIPIATEAASNAKTWGSVVCFLLGLFTIASIGVVADSGSLFAAEKEDPSSTVLGLAVWFVVLGAVALRCLRTAKRAAAAVRSATNHPDAYSFYLAGKLIIVTDSLGAPQPDRSFKVSSKLRTMLLAVPRATIVDTSR